jgi:hypothetical protein
MNIYTSLLTLSSLLVFWGFICYVWRDYRLDAFREDLFELRDRMFLYAAQGNISFSHPAYALLRNRMNVLLRYAHGFTLTSLFIVGMTGKNTKNIPFAEWERAVASLPSPTRDRMLEFNQLTAFVALQHIMLRSFFRYVVIRPLLTIILIWLRCTGRSTHMYGLVRQPTIASTVERLESKALEQDARRMGQAVLA